MTVAFYRKYRPQKFSELVGQAAVSVTLLEALKQGRMVHAYLFSGPRGTGKTSTARLIAKAIQCEKRTAEGEPCNECEMCVLSGKGELIDMIEIDAASNRGIDEIRDLREKIRFAPTRAAAKVYIIDEVHMLTKEAFNALLKSLEEPPAHVFFILATTEIHKIPETILSRCQRYDFRRISERDLVGQLQAIAKTEDIEVEVAALELIAKYADGGMRDAISILEQFSNEPLTAKLVQERLGLSSHQSCDELFAALGSADSQKGLAVIEHLHKDGYDLQQFTTSFLGVLRGKLHDAVHGGKTAIVPKLLKWIELFDEAWVKLKRASISQLPLEIAVIRATHVSKPKAEATTQVAAAPAAVTAPANLPGPKPLVQAEPTRRQDGLLQIDTIKKQLPKVIEAIEHSSVRLSFKTGKLAGLEGKVITFVFSSKFHYDKVHSAGAVVEIEEAFKKLTGADVKVICKLDEQKMAAGVNASGGRAMASGAAGGVNTEIDTLGWDTVDEKL
jgi:DNA polymerase III subunit gamma/tau